MLCSYNLETGKRKVLAMGNYHNINVTRYFVFFTSFEDDLMYMAPFENTSVNVFHPTVDETEIKTK